AFPGDERLRRHLAVALTERVARVVRTAGYRTVRLQAQAGARVVRRRRALDDGAAEARAPACRLATLRALVAAQHPVMNAERRAAVPRRARRAGPPRRWHDLRWQAQLASSGREPPPLAAGGRAPTEPQQRHAA